MGHALRQGCALWAVALAACAEASAPVSPDGLDTRPPNAACRAFTAPPTSGNVLLAKRFPAIDVDIVVEATSPVAYYALAGKLRALGFSEDLRDDPPVICRWRHGHYRVDAMPVDGTFMGFCGEWFRAVRDRP